AMPWHIVLVTMTEHADDAAPLPRGLTPRGSALPVSWIRRAGRRGRRPLRADARATRRGPRAERRGPRRARRGGRAGGGRQALPRGAPAARREAPRQPG